jgi:hypothetical protein
MKGEFSRSAKHARGFRQLIPKAPENAARESAGKKFQRWFYCYIRKNYFLGRI